MNIFISPFRLPPRLHRYICNRLFFGNHIYLTIVQQGTDIQNTHAYVQNCLTILQGGGGGGGGVTVADDQAKDEEDGDEEQAKGCPLIYDNRRLRRGGWRLEFSPPNDRTVRCVVVVY